MGDSASLANRLEHRGYPPRSGVPVGKVMDFDGHKEQLKGTVLEPLVLAKNPSSILAGYQGLTLGDQSAW